MIYTAPFEQGFRFGDILVAINGTRVESVFQVAVLLTEAPSDLVSVRLFRRGKFITLTPTIPQRRLAGAADYPLGSTGK